MAKKSPSRSKSAIFNDLSDIVALAQKVGATDAVASYGDGRNVSVSVRMGKVENISSAQAGGLTIKILVGKRTASDSLIMKTPQELEAHLKAMVARAKASPENPYEGLADPSQIIKKQPNLDILDTGKAPDAKELAALATAVENAMFAESKLIVNSEGASASYHRGRAFTVASNGLKQCETYTSFGYGVSGIAEKNGAMETDGDWTSARHRSDLRSPADVGKRAAQRCIEKLDAKKVKGGQVPVILDPRVSGSLLRAFTSAISGNAVAKKQTFLLSALGQKVFADGIRIVDDPSIPRALGSDAYDSQGIPRRKTVLVDNGVLQTWILDLRSARQLNAQNPGANFETTGHAGGLTNLFMEPGTISPEDMIRGVKDGFYVTSLQGAGGNTLTGDYSTGASGFWIENGKLTYAVSEMTIAGKLQDMFLNLTPASDLDLTDRRTAAPTLRIDGMTVSGK